MAKWLFFFLFGYQRMSFCFLFALEYGCGCFFVSFRVIAIGQKIPRMVFVVIVDVANIRTVNTQIITLGGTAKLFFWESAQNRNDYDSFVSAKFYGNPF